MMSFLGRRVFEELVTCRQALQFSGKEASKIFIIPVDKVVDREE